MLVFDSPAEVPAWNLPELFAYLHSSAEAKPLLLKTILKEFDRATMSLSEPEVLRQLLRMLKGQGHGGQLSLLLKDWEHPLTQATLLGLYLAC